MHGTIRILGLTLALAAAATAGAAELRGGANRHLEQIRQRLRAEAGACEVPGEDSDLPMVALTVLPGDTHRRLAVELTGNSDAEAVLRRIEPDLRPGERIFVPRRLLGPRLADPRLEALTLGQPYPTLWTLAKEATVTRGLGVAVSVRNLQRLNAIADPTALPKRAKILVPRSLLRGAVSLRAPPVRIRTDFRATDLSGLERRLRPQELPRALLKEIRHKGLWKRQFKKREVDLIVVHTTEHRGAPAENVARYLQRKRLANYFVGPRGTVYEIVPEKYRSFGCGQSLWEGHYAVDHEAINVEIYADTAPGVHHTGISDAQYAGLRGLLELLRARHPGIHEGRVVTHRMVALNYAYGTRSRKGDPYEFDWAKAGLPDNSRALDQDVLVGRAKLCTDERYVDRVTPGQTAAARLQSKL